MGKMAARTGDPVMTCNDPADLPVGTVMSTTATVFIGGVPAAKQFDKVVGVDTHIVMVPAPPGPPVPTPLPHPFNGMLMDGLSNSVKIEGLPAATVDSVAKAIPPHIPTPPGVTFQKPPMNEGKVFMGCPTVLIDNGGGGGGGGTGGDGGGSTAEVDGSGTEAQNHRIDIDFKDKGGFPISGPEITVEQGGNVINSSTLGGSGVHLVVSEESSAEVRLRAITKAEWSKTEARDGETVKMKMEGVGFEDGTTVTFEVWLRDIRRPDRLVTSVDSDTSGDKAEADWQYTWANEEPSGEVPQRTATPRYSEPSFYFIVKLGQVAARSPILGYKDYVEITLRDHNDQPAGGAKYRVVLPNGEVRTGTLDDNGYKKLENVPPGNYRVEFPEAGVAEESGSQSGDSDSGSDG